MIDRTRVILMAKKISLSVGVSIVSIVLAVVIFVVGFHLGTTVPKTVVVRGVDNLTSASGTAKNADFGLFWRAWQLIEDHHLHGADISNQDKVYGTVKGLVGSLGDPYSEFFTPKDGDRFQQDVQGNFGGIGAEIGIRDGQLVIIAPLKDTPAFRAGLKPLDKILSINATSTDGVALEDAVSRIRGSIGSIVTLNIFRDGWAKPKEFNITRDKIVSPTLDYQIKEGNVGYIQLYQFNANVNDLFYKAGTSLLKQGAKGIVLDLRGNPGGYLDVAVDLAGWFLPRGKVVVSEASRKGIENELRTQGNAAFASLPVVVLIDKGSASASEILAGALRDDRGTKLIGEQSFGKGTVQEIEQLPDGSSMKLTIAHWVLPSGHILENGGLKPDIEVKFTDEDATAKRDPQLEKALEVVRQEIKK